MLQIRDRLLGKEIRYQAPAVLRFEVLGLHEERFAHVEGTVIVVVLIPFVLGVVDLIVHSRVCKVKLTSGMHEA